MQMSLRATSIHLPTGNAEKRECTFVAEARAATETTPEGGREKMTWTSSHVTSIPGPTKIAEGTA